MLHLFFLSRASDSHRGRPRHVRGRGVHGEPELRGSPHGQTAQEGHLVQGGKGDLLQGTQERSLGECQTTVVHYYTVIDYEKILDYLRFSQSQS